MYRQLFNRSRRPLLQLQRRNFFWIHFQETVHDVKHFEKYVMIGLTFGVCGGIIRRTLPTSTEGYDPINNHPNAVKNRDSGSGHH